MGVANDTENISLGQETAAAQAAAQAAGGLSRSERSYVMSTPGDKKGEPPSGDSPHTRKDVGVFSTCSLSLGR